MLNEIITFKYPRYQIFLLSFSCTHHRLLFSNSADEAGDVIILVATVSTVHNYVTCLSEAGDYTRDVKRQPVIEEFQTPVNSTIHM